MKVYVVAGSTQEYERWLRGPGTAWENATIKPLTNAQTIRSTVRTTEIVLLQGWKSRPDWKDIYNAMLATGRTARV